MFDRLMHVVASPTPIRVNLVKMLDLRLNFLSYEQKVVFGSIARPHYGYCLLQAARLAHKLGRNRISAIEFGVAGGNGLLALEAHAERVERETAVSVAVYGFDSATGLPPSRDFRDLPYVFWAGQFPMEVEKLRSKLQRSKLIIGPVEETVRTFIEREDPPPIGFISIDLDYYSSTRDALPILEAPHRCLLPRVAVYFDDTSGDMDLAYNEFTGEMLALREFNQHHDNIKIAPVRGLRYSKRWIPRMWHEQVFVSHIFNHPDYERPIYEHRSACQLDLH